MNSFLAAVRKKCGRAPNFICAGWLMRFFSALFGSKQADTLAPGRGWIVPVVGEASYQDALRSAYRKNGGKGHDLKVSAVLAPENRNRFDENAVLVEIDGRAVGFLPRELAVQYRAALGETAGQCSAKIVGGFEREDGTTAHFGVKLNVAWPPRLK
jgi:hypothetical protein